MTPRGFEKAAPQRTASAVLERFAGLRVLVVGDAVLDVWSYGRVERLTREAPLPVVTIEHEQRVPGAAANVAANAAALGAHVRYAGLLGDDRAGSELRAALDARGVDTSAVVTDPTRSTVAKHRVVSEGQVTARFDHVRGQHWSRGARRALLGHVRELAADADLVLLADYDEGALGDSAAPHVRAIRDRIDAPLVVDGHAFARWARCRPTAVTPNASEAVALIRAPSGRESRLEALTAASAQLFTRTGAGLVLVTLDADGMALFRRAEPPYRTFSVRAPAQNTCGAGDTSAAAFGMALARGADPALATDLAQAAASVVVQHPGTSCCTRHELALQYADTSTEGALSHAEVAGIVAARRAAGARVVFTNGCFDVLHLGHVHYLKQARALGDLLVVAVNSDASVQRLKGPSRPVVPEAERAGLVAALGSVDVVTLFEEDSPTTLLELLEPDVYVKGGDYTPDMLPEAALVRRLGGQVVTVGYLPNHSTTELLGRIQQPSPAAIVGGGARDRR